MSAKEKPLIAITMGDAAGIGPEIIVKTLMLKQISDICRPLIIGTTSVMEKAIQIIGSPLKVQATKNPNKSNSHFGTIDLFDMQNLDISEVETGRVCRACGKAAMEFIAEAAKLVIDGVAQALVTTPINKEATAKAGYTEMGHLDFLARLTGSTENAIMLAAGPLKVVHLTTHHSLKKACEMVTRERVLARLKLTHESFERWGIDNPRIGVAAINPHAGEGGLLGLEEIEEIGPAIREARDLKIDARGPFPADSVFNRAISGEFDVVLAMYHDQGHIAIKVYGLETSVSVALGLPFIRTSVDHGTAFDIAGKGIASHLSLVEAIKVAVGLIQKKRLTDL